MNTGDDAFVTNPGFFSGAKFHSRAEILTNAARVASGLASLKVGNGDRVAFLMRNDVPILEVTAGAGMLGAITVPINWHFKAAEVQYILEDSGASVLIAHADLLGPIRDELSPAVRVVVVDAPQHVVQSNGGTASDQAASDGDLSWTSWLAAQNPWDGPPRTSSTSMVYTSGTTGRPKGVRRQAFTAEQRAAFTVAAEQTLGLTEGSRTIISAPMYHSAPNATAMFALQVGAMAVLQPRFDAEGLLALIDRYKITTLQLVPAMFVQLLNLPERVRNHYNLESLVHVTHTAAPCPPDVKRRMIDWWGPVIYEFYGSTETGAVAFCSSEEWLAHPGTVGHPVEGATVKILAADGRELPAGEVGEIYSRLDMLPSFTYHGTNTDTGADSSLLASGDLGYLDRDGFLYVCDRKADLVIMGGTNIYPAEVEAALGGMPEVVDCAVFGIPDERLGEVLAAVVQPVPGSSVGPGEITAFLREHIADYKIPKVIEFSAELPREESGKIFKRKLRDPYWAGTSRAI